MSEHSLVKRHTSATASKKYLHPAEADFCFWLSQYKAAPPIARQLEKAEELFGCEVDEDALQKVKRSKPFRDYLGKLEKMSPEQAKELAREYIDSKLPHAMAAHFQAIAMLQKLGDWKDVAKFTNPLLDRVYPKKEEQNVQAMQVTINLQPHAHAAMLDDVVEVEAEVLSDET